MVSGNRAYGIYTVIADQMNLIKIILIQFQTIWINSAFIYFYNTYHNIILSS